MLTASSKALASPVAVVVNFNNPSSAVAVNGTLRKKYPAPPVADGRSVTVSSTALSQEVARLMLPPQHPRLS